MANLTCVFEIRNMLLVMTKFREGLNQKSDAHKSKIRILNDLRKLELAFIEYIDLCSSNTRTEFYLTQVRDMIDVIKDMEDVESFKSILTSLEDIEAPDELSNYEIKYRIREIMENGSESNLLSPVVPQSIGNKIKASRELKVFDPRCKEGENMRAFKRGCSNIYLYGLEESVSYASEAKDIINRCIKGGLLGSKISNDVFDVLFYVPEISWSVDFTLQGTLMERKEKAAIRNTIKYLRPNGLYVYTIPYYRLTKEIAFMFSKLLREVSIVRHTPNAEATPYVTIIGYKDVTRDSRQDIYEELSNTPYNEIQMHSALREYFVDGPAQDVQFFRGSILDDEELDSICTGSGLYGSFWDKQNCKSNLHDTRPLLPFNMGQIGLVLTSGCLDGIIEEYEGQYHAIKGMVTKVKKTTTETNDDNTEQTAKEVYGNIVQINIFAPDGEFIELA